LRPIGCHVIDDPWQDGAITIRFYDEDHSVKTLLDSVRFPADRRRSCRRRPAGRNRGRASPRGWACRAIPFMRRKSRATRNARAPRLRDAGLPVPWFVPSPLYADPGALVTKVDFPCVIKPVALSGSRGVMRADNVAAVFLRHTPGCKR